MDGPTAAIAGAELGAKPATEAQLRRLHAGHPSELVGLTPADAGPGLSAHELLEAATAVNGVAQMPRRRAEALLDALRSENARLRSQITACATASATASPERAQSPKLHAGKQLAVLSGVGSFLNAAWGLAVAYGKGCIGRQAAGQELEDAEGGVDRRATVALTIGPQKTLAQDLPGVSRPELTGRLVANRYDWPTQTTADDDGASGAASLPVELAALFERAGLPPPVSAAKADGQSDAGASDTPVGPAARSEWLYVVSFSVQLMSVTYSNEVKKAVEQLERAALDPTSDEAVAGLVAILCDGPAEDDDIIHVRALLCASDATAAELRAERTTELGRRREMQRLKEMFNASDEEELEPFPLDQTLEATQQAAVPNSDSENRRPQSTEKQGNHFITSGSGPPWPCMPGCSCASRDTKRRVRKGARADGGAEEDVEKVMLGSVTWSLPEDLTMLLQGDGTLLDRIQGKFRASMSVAHAWWLHPDGDRTHDNQRDGKWFRQWTRFASTAATLLRISTTATTNMHFNSMRLIFNKLCAVAVAHDTLKKQDSEAPLNASESGPALSSFAATDGSWARRAIDHRFWDLLGHSGDDLAHQIRSKLLEWSGGLLGHPESLSSAIFAVYSAVVRDVYALTNAELWVVKLDCKANSTPEVSSADHGISPRLPNGSGSNQHDRRHDILRTSTLGSAVQIQAELKGCHVPAWLPLMTAMQELPVPAAQPKTDWEAEADWSGDLSKDDDTDLWSADVPGERATDGRSYHSS